MRPLFRITGAIFILLIVGFGGFALWAHQPAIAPITPPMAASFNQADIQRGALLAAAGDCAECHTAPGGAPLAGGYPLPTPFGIIYGSNITPDPNTGIGNWSEIAFARALRQGVRQDGALLYPAFPYNHFTLVSDNDVKALYAYLMTRPTVRNRVKPPAFPFPLNVRMVMAGWNLFYFKPGRFQPDPSKSDAWNRGAYLAEGLGHCEACHTPRNILGAETTDAYAGGVSEGWVAPALDRLSPAAAPWTQAELATYLANGFMKTHGFPAGPMAGVTHDLAQLPPQDVQAVATYIASIEPPPSPAATTEAVAVAQASSFKITTAQQENLNGPATTGAEIFAGACASCHFSGGAQPFYRPVDLFLSSAVNAPKPTDFVNIVTHGVTPLPGTAGRMMPPFAGALSPEEIAAVAAYVRGHFSKKPAWTGIDKAISQSEPPAS
jgi:mono/diheme cytochrome c family protein